jgi:hypothetical protein
VIALKALNYPSIVVTVIVVVPTALPVTIPFTSTVAI